MDLPKYTGDAQELFSTKCQIPDCKCSDLEIIGQINECVACGHTVHDHRDPQGMMEQIMRKMVLLGKTNEDILLYLQDNGFKTSLRTLKRRLQEYGIRRTEALDPATILNFVQIGQYSLNQKVGYRRIYRYIRDECNIPMNRDVVQAAMRLLDPDGPRLRIDRRCHQRIFICEGPNHLWSIDGHDKLSLVGIYIHGCVDAFSRKLIWCHTARSNSDPRKVAKYYLDALCRYKVVPKRTRMDPGTENYTIAECQMFLRRNHEDQYAGDNSNMVYRSKLNQKIECIWSGMYVYCTSVLQDKMRELHNQAPDPTDPDNHNAFLYVYFDEMKEQIDKYVRWWNNHRISKQSKIALPSGEAPDEMYKHPERKGGVNFHCPPSLDDIAVLKAYHDISDEEDEIIPPDFKLRADEFLQENNLVLSQETARYIYRALCQL